MRGLIPALAAPQHAQLNQQPHHYSNQRVFFSDKGTKDSRADANPTITDRRRRGPFLTFFSGAWASGWFRPSLARQAFRAWARTRYQADRARCRAAALSMCRELGIHACARVDENGRAAGSIAGDRLALDRSIDRIDIDDAARGLAITSTSTTSWIRYAA